MVVTSRFTLLVSLLIIIDSRHAMCTRGYHNGSNQPSRRRGPGADESPQRCNASKFGMPLDMGKWRGNEELLNFLSKHVDEDESTYVNVVAAAHHIANLAGIVPLGVHGTDMVGLKNIVKTGIKVSPEFSSSQYQLMGPGFYMYSLAYGSVIKGAKLGPKLAWYADLASRTNQLRIRQLQGKRHKPPKVFAIFGALASVLSGLCGADVSGCAEQYAQAKNQSGYAHKLIIDEQADFVVSPTTRDGAAELVAREGLARSLKLLAVVSNDDDCILCLMHDCDVCIPRISGDTCDECKKVRAVTSK